MRINFINGLGRISINLLLLLFGIFLILFFSFSQSNNELLKTERTIKLDDKELFLYLEAITRIKENALFLKEDITQKELIQDTLKAYLNEMDVFSDYLSREEYLQFNEFQSDKYVGIGMEIEKNKNGEIICFPYPGSAAERAGIKTGDRLKSIDGVSVDGKSIFNIASLARGEEGSKVDLVIINKNGVSNRIRVPRSDVQIESISKQQVDKIPVIKILAFTNNTKNRLKAILSTWDKGAPMVFDLRGNPGGDLHAAIDSAMLFLKKGKKILSIRTRHGSKVYESSNGALSLHTPMVIWQDEATASAAEVFIAALADNNKAVSIGKKTFGKGTKQDIIELSDGSALILTTAYLQTPKGTEFEGEGLTPSYQLTEPADTQSYLKKTEEIIGSNALK